MGAVAPPGAQAAPPTVWTACDGEAGDTQCSVPRGLAADPDTGHVFVADQANFRVDDYSAHGQLARAWGWDVVASGPGDTAADEFEVCVPADGDTCQPGAKGSGIGQFDGVHGVAVGSAGSVYVTDRNNRRVQKFSPKGEFLLMIGGEVNETSGGNVCPRPGFPADACKAAPAASGGGEPGEFGAWVLGTFIAVDLNGTESDADDILYVGDVGRIQAFDADGAHQGDIAVPGETLESLAVDSAGFLYAIYNNKADVRKIDPSSGEELASPRFALTSPIAVAVDVEGSVYASAAVSFANPIFKFDPAGAETDNFGIEEYDRVEGLATNLCPGNEAPGNLYATNTIFGDGAFVRAYGTPSTLCGQAITGQASNITETTATLNGKVNPRGEEVTSCLFEYGLDTGYGSEAPCEESSEDIGEGEELVDVHADISGLDPGTVYHVRLAIETAEKAEAGSDETFKTLGPPVISGEHLAGATFTELTLRAQVNPEGLGTECRVLYGKGEALDRATDLVPVGEDRSEHPVQVLLAGLSPATQYSWQFVCVNVSGTSEGPVRTATTFSPPSGAGDCPNSELRGGASARLPDCRAYEMVSPVDKNGGDIYIGDLSSPDDPGGYIQSSPGGGRLAYSAQGATFAGQPAGMLFNQYLADRGSGGWSTLGIHPPVTGTPVDAVLFGQVREFMAFTPDLCSAWVIDFQTPALTADAQAGYRNLYRQDNCGPGAGGLEALTSGQAPLPQESTKQYVTNTSVQGVSEDGAHAAFVADAPLVQDCRTSVSATDFSVTYRWLRNGIPIAGASGPTYRPTADDAGATLQCQVFAISANTGSSQASVPASVIPPEAGVTIAPPVAPGGPFPLPPGTSGALTVGGPGGQTLTCNPFAGAWEGEPTFSFGWYRNGAQIPGAEGSTYEVTEADLATPAAFQCAVTGANEDGAVMKLSGNRLTSPAPSSPAAPSVDAANGGNFKRVFLRSGGANHLASVLPSGRPAGGDSAVGSGWAHHLQDAVSADGSRVYFTTGIDNNGEGRILQRLHPEQGIVAGECDEAGQNACTTPVGGGALARALFWQATPDGEKALFGELTLDGDSLFVFSEGEPRRKVADDVEGVAGASEDLERIYFISRDALDEGATAGEPNLYLDDRGTVSFIGTLTEGDVGAREEGFFANAYDVGAKASNRRPTRVSPDGSRIVFQSQAPLTGFDNETAEGKPAVEVFSYQAGGELICVSCNPSGARPEARELLQPYRKYDGNRGNPTGVFAAAWVPTPEHPTHASNVLSADGKRIFFNSTDPLLPRDNNGAQDVYEWEAAGSGSCDAGDANHFPQNGGCVYLISSAESSFETEFWEASPDGDDVFFTTDSSLLSQDPGLIDLYDARVNGGYPEPEEKAACEGEACQSPPPPPEYPTGASAAFRGPGNPRALPDCGARARRAARLSRRAKHNKRAARKADHRKAKRRMRSKGARLAKRARRTSNSAKRCRRANRRALR